MRFSSGATVCSSTGLNLVPSVGQRIFRVAKTTFGALNPPPRVRGGIPVQEWSRWDTLGRTIYGASSAAGGFVEVLEYIRPDPPATALSELFDDVGPEDAATFADQVARELPAHGGMMYRSIPKDWRQTRSLYELALPDGGWFVDVTGAESVSVITRELGPTLLAQCGIGQLTVSELTSSAEEFKELTTVSRPGFEAWSSRMGSVRTGSSIRRKWGSTLDNWAMWLRRADDGTGVDPVTLVETSDIGRHTKPFVEAAKLRGMRIY